MAKIHNHAMKLLLISYIFLFKVSHGSQDVISDVKRYGSAGLTSSGAPSGGSRSFKVLQQITDNNDDETGTIKIIVK